MSDFTQARRPLINRHQADIQQMVIIVLNPLLRPVRIPVTNQLERPLLRRLHVCFRQMLHLAAVKQGIHPLGKLQKVHPLTLIRPIRLANLSHLEQKSFRKPLITLIVNLNLITNSSKRCIVIVIDSRILASFSHILISVAKDLSKHPTPKNNVCAGGAFSL